MLISSVDILIFVLWFFKALCWFSFLLVFLLSLKCSVWSIEILQMGIFERYFWLELSCWCSVSVYVIRLRWVVMFSFSSKQAFSIRNGSISLWIVVHDRQPDTYTWIFYFCLGKSSYTLKAICLDISDLTRKYGTDLMR